MAKSTPLGAIDDRVRLYLGGHEAAIIESYEVVRGILTQPSTFTARLGWGGVAKDLLSVMIPNTPFELKINDAPMFTGFLDDVDASGEIGATEITIYGRDALAPMHDSFIEEELDFSDKTYFEIVDIALRATVKRDYLIITSNSANRRASTGIGLKDPGPGAPDAAKSKSSKAAKTLKAHIGERWYECIKRILDRAGLFLWATAEGDFVLSAPKTDQDPIYRILRRRGQTRNAVTVTTAHFKNHTSGRYSEARMLGRGGGRKFGRTKIKGTFTDPEMVDLGIVRPLVLHDVNVSTSEQAEFYAQRKLAETRRAGWSLVYTVSGHTVPSLLGGARAVWCPDTVVDVIDDEFGIVAPLYLERVAYRRNPQTTCELTLCRPNDMLFGKAEDE